MSGLRVDGRRPAEVRRLRSELGGGVVVPGADGSAIVEQGNTKVLAAVYGPREGARFSDAEADRAVITVDFSIAPYATSERRKRRGKTDRKLLEAAASLRQSFEAAVLTKLYPRSEISVRVLVLQSDGGALAAALNAGTLALMDAGVGMRDFVVACSLAYIQRTALLGEFLDCWIVR